MAAAADQLVRPVLAAVEEGPHLTVAIAQAEQVFSRHFKGKVVAGFGHLVDVTSEPPGPDQQPVTLSRKNLRVGAVAPFERADDRRGLVHGQNNSAANWTRPDRYPERAAAGESDQSKPRHFLPLLR